jgi:hypothetical protein
MNRCVLPVTLCLTLVTASWATASLAQQGPPNGLGVNVLNTPLAVTGSVTTSGSVSLTPGSSVSVINTPSNPVPVREIGEPFQALAQSTLSSPVTFPTVPAGKRLVIEHFSVEVNNNTSGVFPNTCILSNGDGASNDYFAIQPTFSNSLNHFWVGSVKTKFYAETGKTPQIFCDFGFGQSGGISAFVSGYFTPVP